MDSSWDDAPYDGTRATASCDSPGRVRVMRLVSVDPVRGLSVAPPDAPGSEMRARSTVAVRPSDCGRSVLVVHEDDDPSRPIITGLLLDEPIVRTRNVRVDGRHVEIEAEAELVLRSGKASITLAADGAITIRGMHIVSRARGTHKVKGATVRIN